MRWDQQRVVVTGGASFIGSALADALVERGARVRVVDNLSSGELSNLQKALDAGTIQFLEVDLLDPKMCQSGDGLHRTIDWYFRTKNREQVAAILDQVLTERTVKPSSSQVVAAN